MSTMKLHRIQIKTFLKEPSTVEAGALIPVFHQWIQKGALDEMLIDVANYEHVPEGPAILLIAHEADFALDRGNGRAGLLYTRKRRVPESLREALELSLRSLFKAADLLEGEPMLDGTYAFDTKELEIGFLDRLRVPNDEASLDLVRKDVIAALKGLYDEEDITLEWTRDDARLPFRIRATLGSSPAPSVLAERLAVSR